MSNIEKMQAIASSAHADDEPAFLPIRAVAIKIGIPYKILLEAVNDGSVRHYRLGRSRRLLRLEDVIDAMKLSEKGEKK